MPTKRLIINADDCGLTAGVNRAIVEAGNAGLLTSTTVMANGDAFQDAVEHLRSAPQLSTGCHVVLVDGTPISESPLTLLGEGGRDFPSALTVVIRRALTGKLDAAQIEAEVSAQIRKLQAAGIVVSHVDTHKHTHLCPQILKPILRAASACGVRAIRNPFGRLSFNLAAARPRMWKRYAQLNVLHRLAGPFERAVREAGMVTPAGSIGVAATGWLDEDLFRESVRNLSAGTWEFVCHPGYNDLDLDRVNTRLRASREKELEVLTSPRLREFLAGEGIELVSYRDLQG